MNRKYISVVESAKLIRQALKESFPGVKFSVKSSSYSGGSSIRVSWVDGPASALVNGVVSPFKGGYFDGMIDYAGSVYAKLDGESVQFLADHVSLSREYSDAKIAQAIRFLAGKYGEQILAGLDESVAEYKRGGLWNIDVFGGPSHIFFWSLREQVSQVLSKMSDRAMPCPSPLLARVQPDGDDGYGQGCVGQNGSGGGLGYPRVKESAEQQPADQAAPALPLNNIVNLADYQPSGLMQ